MVQHEIFVLVLFTKRDLSFWLPYKLPSSYIHTNADAYVQKSGGREGRITGSAYSSRATCGNPMPACVWKRMGGAKAAKHRVGTICEEGRGGIRDGRFDGERTNKGRENRERSESDNEIDGFMDWGIEEER